MIDFNDPNTLSHQGKRIPIDTQEKFDAVQVIVRSIYTDQPEGKYDADAQGDYEKMVRKGLSLAELVTQTTELAKRRFPSKS